MRECVYNAGLLTTLNSANLEFITEPKAVVLRCLNVVKDHNLRSGGLLRWLGRKVRFQALGKLKRSDDDLESLERCSAIFLIGEFSYLLSRIRGVFIDQVSIIAVPALSTAVAARGAITYGSNVERTFLNGLMGKFFKVWLRVKKRKMENRLLYS
ncbi:unnamed protein product [Rhizophagus irregularis]|nr:unnamed protein product [Rhizophagus irregularis]